MELDDSYFGFEIRVLKHKLVKLHIIIRGSNLGFAASSVCCNKIITSIRKLCPTQASSAHIDLRRQRRYEGCVLPHTCDRG